MFLQMIAMLCRSLFKRRVIIIDNLQKNNILFFDDGGAFFVISIVDVASAQADITKTLIAKNGQVIKNLKISSVSGPCIIIPENAANIQINANKIGPCGNGVDDVGVRIEKGAHHISVSGNTIHDVSSGIYAAGAHHPIVIEKNIVYNVRGPMPRGQMVQFDGVSGGVGQSRIFGNISDKNLSTRPTAYEDHISMYMSYGTKEYPILIACNKIRGGDSATGSGIMIGDYGGDWFIVRHNIIVLTSNTGIGVAGAKYAAINNNLIWNRGHDRSSKTSEAISIFSYANHIPRNISIYQNDAVANSWIGEGDGSISEGLYDDKTGQNIVYRANHWQNENLQSSIWDRQIDGCQ
jgi:hypothetical protein